MADRAFCRGLRSAGALTLVACSVLWAVDAGSAESHPAFARPTCHGEPATIVGTPRDDDILGSARDDVIVGGGGLDNIFGGAGNDIICGGLGPSRVEEGEAVYQSLSGGPGNDVVIGGPDRDELGDFGGSDLLIGGGGGDLLMDYDRGAGRDDDDVLRGGAGTDSLYGSRGVDKLLGGSGDDLFQDALGDNVFRGGDGDDRFDSGQGNDTIVGGPGVDAAHFVATLHSGSSSSHCNDVTANLSTGIAFGTGFGVDSLKGVENLASGGGEDVLTGDSRNNTFYVGTACPGVSLQRDSVAGGGGRDRIDFDSGAWDYSSAFGPVVVDLAVGTVEQQSASPLVDTIASVALDSVENVNGTEFGDTILGDDGPNRISPGPSTYSDGGDLMRGRGGDDDLFGSVGADEIYGDEGADEIFGDRGNDRLDGGPDTNGIDGGRGRDTCWNPDRHDGAVNCES